MNLFYWGGAFYVATCVGYFGVLYKDNRPRSLKEWANLILVALVWPALELGSRMGRKKDKK